MAAPPRLGGGASGGATGAMGATAYSGFGHVGDAGRCYAQLARTFLCAGEVGDNVEQDSVNVEKYVKELASLLVDTIQAAGKKFEEEHLRMINMVTSIHPGGGGGGTRFNKGIMEHGVIQNLRAVSVDKGLFLQWHQKFTTALGQAKTAYEEIVHKLAREIDFGGEMGTILSTLGT